MPRLSDIFKVGDIVDGVIDNMAPFGAFVRMSGGEKGLLHITNIKSTNRVKHPNQVFRSGDKVKCTVVSIDEAKCRLELSTDISN